MAARREGRGAPAGPGRRGAAGASHLGPEQPATARVDRRVQEPFASALALAGAPGPFQGVVAPSHAGAALRAAMRALPPAIEAARLHDGTRLTLALGGALGVDLRGGPAGVEVTLRPAEALGQVAAAELPALIAAVRARGVRVAHVALAPGAARPPRSPGRQPR